MAYKNHTPPLCKQCGDRHVNTKICGPRRALREAQAAADSTEAARLERNRNTLPELELRPGGSVDGMRPWGDRLTTLSNVGGVLSQIRPPRPGGVRIPDEWRED